MNYPDIGTLYRGEEGLGAALTDQAPAAETRSRALTPEELTALFREDLLRELGWDCGQLGERPCMTLRGPCSGSRYGGGVGEEAQTSFALTLAPGDLPATGGGRPRRGSDGGERDRGHRLAPDRGTWTGTAGQRAFVTASF